MMDDGCLIEDTFRRKLWCQNSGREGASNQIARSVRNIPNRRQSVQFKVGIQRGRKPIAGCG